MKRAGDSLSTSKPQGDDGWLSALALIDALKRMDAPLRKKLRKEFQRHNDAMQEIGGDPLREDWRKFRPLRLSREEDWSDWLAWLIEHSESGTFAGLLFNRPSDASARPAVEREVLLGQFRVDIRIEWHPASAGTVAASTVLEVKVGDQQFAKTRPAAEAHRRAFQEAQCEDWILVPSEDREACAVAGVRILTWDELAIALRRCITRVDETVAWRVWARTFLGAVEQSVLGFPHETEFDSALDITTCVRHLEASHGERS